MILTNSLKIRISKFTMSRSFRVMMCYRIYRRVTVMIRELRKADINKVADIWLDTNRKTHRQYLFIKEKGLRFSIVVWMKLLRKKTM